MRRPAAWVALAAFVAYAVLMRMGPGEVVRAVGGVVALWGPVGVVVFALLRREVPEALPRGVFAGVASYALTTALYFGCCAVWSPALFYVIYGVFVAGAVGVFARGWWGRRAQPRGLRLNGGRVDWVLVAVVAMTLVAFSRYQRPYEVDQRTGDVGIITSPDQTYFCGLAYELARHTPPVQQVCQAGVPERAYHLLPHVAAMLTARFTGQSDMMRAHMGYDYATLTVLACLALYVIGSRVGGSRVAGYFAAALLVIVAIPMPPVAGGSPGYFGFTIWPLATSLTEPAFITSPQTYTGMAVTFGVLVGVVLMCERLRAGEGFGVLALVCGLMVATLMRFRAHVFIPMFPGFLAVLAYGWFRAAGGRRWPLVAAAGVTAAASGLLYAEMHWAGYLHETTGVVVGFHPNYRPFMDSWPGADAVRRWVWGSSAADGAGAGYGWQAFSIVVFALLNLIGIPMLVASGVWLRRRRTWVEWGPYAALTAWLVVASVGGALFLTSAYDPYSLGGQMLLHCGWYLLPPLAVEGWRLAGWVMGQTSWAPRAWGRLGWALAVAATVTQVTRGFSQLERYNWKHGVVMTKNVGQAIDYLRDHTPADAVIIANGPIEPEFNWSVVPGVAGRASYLTYTEITSGLLPQQDVGGAVVGAGRQAVIGAIWHAGSPRELASLLAGTGADYLVEFSNRPLAIAPPPGVLREVWASPAKGIVRVRIFRVVGSGE